MKRDIERERPQRVNEWVERRRLQIEEEKLQNSRDFKEITFAITLFGGLLAFLIKLKDYFNSNILVINGYSLYIIYITIGVSLIVLSILLLYLIFKWSSVSQKNENKLLNDLTQHLFGQLPLFILLWMILTFLNFVIYHIENVSISFNIIYLIPIIVIGFVFSILYYINKNTFSLKKIKYYVSLQTDKKLVYGLCNIIILLTIVILTTPLIALFPSYFITGSYFVETFPPTGINDDIMIFTIKETGVAFPNNNVILYKLETGYGILNNIDAIKIRLSKGTLSKNKLMYGKNHEGIWYLNLNTSDLTSGNYMLHAEVTNDLTEKSIFGTIKKHDDILFYIPPKTDPQSYYSTKQE